jgi:hypothetical protein
MCSHGQHLCDARKAMPLAVDTHMMGPPPQNTHTHLVERRQLWREQARHEVALGEHHADVHALVQREPRSHLEPDVPAAHHHHLQRHGQACGACTRGARGRHAACRAVAAARPGANAAARRVTRTPAAGAHTHTHTHTHTHARTHARMHTHTLPPPTPAFAVASPASSWSASATLRRYCTPDSCAPGVPKSDSLMGCVGSMSCVSRTTHAPRGEGWCVGVSSVCGRPPSPPGALHSAAAAPPPARAAACAHRGARRDDERLPCDGVARGEREALASDVHGGRRRAREVGDAMLLVPRGLLALAAATHAGVEARQPRGACCAPHNGRQGRARIGDCLRRRHGKADVSSGRPAALMRT